MTQDIQTIINKNYEENIQYFQMYHPKIYQKLSEFEVAVDKGYFTPQYELSYENDSFDVKDILKNSTLYNAKESKYNALAVKSIHFDNLEDTFATFHQIKVSDEDLQNSSTLTPFTHAKYGHYPIMHYAQKASKQDILLKKLEKFIFFGTGLGRHLTAIDKKIASQAYLIIEDNLELFRLSTMTTNYKNISKKAKLFFSIFDERDEFFLIAEEFLDYKPYLNHYIKFFHMINHSQTKKEQFHLATSLQSHLSFVYSDLLTQLIKPVKYISDGYKILQKTSSLSVGHLKEKPFLLIAAGPSLQKNIKWLKENHHNFFIVAVSVTLSYLESEEIHVDIITQLDGQQIAMHYFDKIKDMNYFKNSICFFSDRIHSDVVNLFKKEQIFMFENGTHYMQNSLKPTAPCVGSLSYQLLLLLKVNTLYLLGLDLSVDSQTGKTHSEFHEHSTLNLTPSKEDSNIIKFKDSLMEVDGNMSEKVFTTPHFFASIYTINNSTRLFKKDITIYNMSDGAKFNDIQYNSNISLKFSTLNIADITHELNKNIQIGFEEKELNMLQKKLEIYAEYKNSLISLSSKHYENPDLFLNDIANFYERVSNYETISGELNEVLNCYLRYVLSYVFNFFNTNEATQENINSFNILLSTHLIEIIDFYTTSIYTDILKEK